MKCLYIPRAINKSNFLFLELEEWILFFPLIIIYVGLPYKFTFYLDMVMAIFIVFWLKNMRINKPKGYLGHYLYFINPRLFKTPIWKRESPFPSGITRYIAG